MPDDGQGFPFDVPELGALRGDTVIIDVKDRVVELGRDITSDETWRLLEVLIPRLPPVSTHGLPAEAASMLCAAFASPRPETPARRRKPKLRVAKGGAP